MNDPIRPRRTLSAEEPRCMGKLIPGQRHRIVEDECYECLRRHAPVDWHTEYIRADQMTSPCAMREEP